MAEVLELSTWAMDSVLQETHRLNMKELRIIESIDIYRILAKNWRKMGTGKVSGSGIEMVSGSIIQYLAHPLALRARHLLLPHALI